LSTGSALEAAEKPPIGWFQAVDKGPIFSEKLGMGPQFMVKYEEKRGDMYDDKR
jgi:hypothetical protein